jgi:hypothetical protein
MCALIWAVFWSQAVKAELPATFPAHPATARLFRDSGSSQNVMHDIPGNVGQAEVAAAVAVG